MTDPGPSSLPRKPTSSIPPPTTIKTPCNSQPSKICAVCPNDSKYTCPRCSLKTCSLACSKSHKASTGCTGERDRAAYVPMSTYTWGTLADDYVFLEDVGRKATSWGRDIVSTGRGRGGKHGARGRATLPPKYETLRVQLAARDIGISFVAEGMEKRRQSQSVWDVRTKTAYLTVEFVFHLQIPDQKDGKTVTPVPFLTHRNDLVAPLFASLISHLKRKSGVPPAIIDLLAPHLDQPEGAQPLPPGLFFAISQLERPKPGASIQYQAPTLPIRVTPQHAPASMLTLISDPNLKPRKVYYPIDPKHSLQSCLRNRIFVEWPTIEVFPSQQVFTEGKFGVLADGTSELTALSGEQVSNKRRKTEIGLVRLIGGYGEESPSESEDLPHEEVKASAIAGLGNYASDEGEEIDLVSEEL